MNHLLFLKEVKWKKRNIVWGCEMQVEWWILHSCCLCVLDGEILYFYVIHLLQQVLLLQTSATTNARYKSV